MNKYDEIESRLTSMANRNRDLRFLKAQAEIDAIQREYEAYTDGVLDAIKAIKQAAGKDGCGDG